MWCISTNLCSGIPFSMAVQLSKEYTGSLRRMGFMGAIMVF